MKVRTSLLLAMLFTFGLQNIVAQERNVFKVKTLSVIDSTILMNSTLWVVTEGFGSKRTWVANANVNGYIIMPEGCDPGHVYKFDPFGHSFEIASRECYVRDSIIYLSPSAYANNIRSNQSFMGFSTSSKKYAAYALISMYIDPDQAVYRNTYLHPTYNNLMSIYFDGEEKPVSYRPDPDGLIRSPSYDERMTETISNMIENEFYGDFEAIMKNDYFGEFAEKQYAAMLKSDKLEFNVFQVNIFLRHFLYSDQSVKTIEMANYFRKKENLDVLLLDNSIISSAYLELGDAKNAKKHSRMAAVRKDGIDFFRYVNYQQLIWKTDSIRE